MSERGDVQISEAFEIAFGEGPKIAGFTPGRVNLIGEHTDYNGGFVLPTALPLGLHIALSPRTDDQVRISSDGFEDVAERTMSEPAKDHWSDYILGALKIAVDQSLIKSGADVSVQTNLPFGAGLSSSAAVTVGILKLLNDLTEGPLTPTDIAVQARRVENEFIGMPCGIMDQMAVAIAHPGQALKLDTQSLEYDLIDLPEDYHMAVVHSGQYRRLSEGRYKVRKEECDAVKSILGRDDICQIAKSDLIEIADDVLLRRARHCMSEHQRTMMAATALLQNDMATFGALMNESHISMRDDFEITLLEIDALVKSSVDLGAIGARMTGGGFGGCIVACVPRENVHNWAEALVARHPEAFYVC